MKRGENGTCTVTINMVGVFFFLGGGGGSQFRPQCVFSLFLVTWMRKINEGAR